MPNRVNIRNPYCIRHDRACCRPSPRSYGNAVRFCKINVVPNHQKIIDEAHRANDVQFVVQSFPIFLRLRTVSFFQPFQTKIYQITVRTIPFRYSILRKMIFPETNLHLTALGYFFRILERFFFVRKESPHLFLTFDIELSSGVAHPVLILQLLSGLQAEKDIVRFRIFFVGIVNIVRHNERNPRFFVQSPHPLVHQLLLRIAMILHFQKEISFAEDSFIVKRRVFRLLIVSLAKCSGNFPRKTGG